MFHLSGTSSCVEIKDQLLFPKAFVPRQSNLNTADQQRYSEHFLIYEAAIFTRSSSFENQSGR